MHLRKKFIHNCSLYLILDAQVCSYDELYDITEKSLSQGVDIIQLRDKTGEAKPILKFANRLLSLTKGEVPFIINDRVDLALIANADGVHLGQDDIAIQHAKEILGNDKIIGVSAQTLGAAQLAQAQGADYIGFGSVYKTQTKPERDAMDLELLARVYREINIPVFAIGGINQENLHEIAEVGVDRIAVTRAILTADDCLSATRQLKEALEAVARVS